MKISIQHFSTSYIINAIQKPTKMNVTYTPTNYQLPSGIG